MGLVLWKDKAGNKTWQSEDYGLVATDFKRVNPKDDPITTGVAPLIEDDVEPAQPAK
jgi:hypothetical protein